MPIHSEQFRRLTHELDALVESLNDCQISKERTKLLRRMKILIDEIDALIFLTSKRHRQATIGSPQPDQPTAES